MHFSFYGTSLLNMVIQAVKDLQEEGKEISHLSVVDHIAPDGLIDFELNNLKHRIQTALRKLIVHELLERSAKMKENSNLHYFTYKIVNKDGQENES